MAKMIESDEGSGSEQFFTPKSKPINLAQNCFMAPPLPKIPPKDQDKNINAKRRKMEISGA